MKSPKRFPLPVRWWLWLAGWRSGKDRFPKSIELPDLPLFPAAEKILREFHGLSVGSDGAGKVFARSRVEINPETLCDLCDEIRELEASSKTRFYPIGERNGGLSILLVTENGEIHDWFGGAVYPVARNFDQALIGMLLGCPYGEDP